METTRIFADLVNAFRPSQGFLLALATLGLILGGILIAIGERDRGIGYLIATGLGTALLFAAEALLRGFGILR
ncbi:MAG: hypothetical protein P3W93_008110 [Thermus sp.]|nr:hypothetical protein [Thermus sp.]